MIDKGKGEPISLIFLAYNERKGYTRAFIDAVLVAQNQYIFFSDTDTG